jgi:hypothetical protein
VPFRPCIAFGLVLMLSKCDVDEFGFTKLSMKDFEEIEAKISDSRDSLQVHRPNSSQFSGRTVNDRGS